MQAAVGEFRYGLLYRPAFVGTVPADLIYRVEPRPERGVPHHDMARHGVLVTDRDLTLEEIQAFELVPLVDGDGLVGLATHLVMASLGEYAAEYLAMAAESPGDFAEFVVDRVGDLVPRVRVSIGDEQEFVRLVSEKLREVLPAGAGSVQG